MGFSGRLPINQAQRWLSEFKQYLQHTQLEQQKTTSNYLLYYLDQPLGL